MCYTTELQREAQALERDMKRRMLEDTRNAYLHPDELNGDGDRSIIFRRVSAFARPFWPVVSNDRPDVIQMMRWGIFRKSIDSEEEAKEFLKQWPTYNALSEEVEHKATYKEAWAKGQRCIIPVTAFYEWQHREQAGRKTPLKVPYKIRSTEEITLLGGIWQDTALGYRTYSILTTAANPLMAAVHNSKKRQPVIIPADMVPFWFSKTLPPDHIKQLCDPIPERDMIAEEAEAA